MGGRDQLGFLVAWAGPYHLHNMGLAPSSCPGYKYPAGSECLGDVLYLPDACVVASGSQREVTWGR